MTSVINITGADDTAVAREAWIRALRRTADIEADPYLTLPALIERRALELDSAPALISSEGSLSYAELAARSNQYARWGLAQGLRAGDVAALLMPNCAEYAAVWLGLTRIGARVALLNTQLIADALVHSIRIVAPRLIVVGDELAGRLAAVRARLGPDLALWVHGTSAHDFLPLKAALESFSGDPLSITEGAPPTLDDTALYIYTSGTTGLPKAAQVSHYRLMRWSQWFAGLMDTQPQDRMYNCLPLYHAVGGIVAIGALLAGGGAVVIRSRFSASDFWRDVRDEKCTLFQYIGELCRYLVNAPPQPIEIEHSLRMACGNGLRPEVWETFQSRFRIPRILEYYASTEGNFSLYNCEGKPGSIGRIPSFLAHRLPVALVRIDIESGEPMRNDKGLCESCAVDEVGEAVGRIPDDEHARAGRFEGYTDATASQRKVLRNVFKKGDAWYRTGDLLRRDAAGFYYFVDRMGDTYRWKGENVSTAEVLSALTASPQVPEGVVFGVTVPGAEGRAGMAALVVNAEFDLEAFRLEVRARLPPYARPVFLRLLSAIESTGTFKPRKVELASAGYDPAQVSDPLFFDDPRANAYVPLDTALYAAIVAGRIRF
jgi:fatty-acyl-CoA synthase